MTDKIKEKALLCAQTMLDKKAQNLKILDLSKLSGFTDFFVIASATSDRGVQAMADAVAETLKKAGKPPLSLEGYSEGRWVLIDFGDLIVHIFLEALREYYDLEKLWSDAPHVKIPAEFYGSAATPFN